MNRIPEYPFLFTEKAFFLIERDRFASKAVIRHFLYSGFLPFPLRAAVQTRQLDFIPAAQEKIILRVRLSQDH